MTTPFLDYTTVDLQFAYWLKRKRQYHHYPVEDQLPPACIDQQLDLLRPLRNPNTSCFILDSRHDIGWRDVCMAIWPDATMHELKMVDALAVEHGVKAFSMVRPPAPPLRLKTSA